MSNSLSVHKLPRSMSVRVARKLAKSHEQRAVVVLGFVNGQWTIASYGKGKVLRDAAADMLNAIANKIDNGTLPIPEPLQS